MVAIGIVLFLTIMGFVIYKFISFICNDDNDETYADIYKSGGEDKVRLDNKKNSDIQKQLNLEGKKQKIENTNFSSSQNQNKNEKKDTECTEIHRNNENKKRLTQMLYTPKNYSNNLCKSQDVKPHNDIQKQLKFEGKKQKIENTNFLSSQNQNKNTKKVTDCTKIHSNNENKKSLTQMMHTPKNHSNNLYKSQDVKPHNVYNTNVEKSGGYHIVPIAPRKGIQKRSNKKCQYGFNGQCYCSKCKRYEKRCLTADCEFYKECIKRDYSKY